MTGQDALLGTFLTAAVSQMAFGAVNALSLLLAPALFARFPAAMGRIFPVAGEALAAGLGAAFSCSLELPSSVFRRFPARRRLRRSPPRNSRRPSGPPGIGTFP